MSMDAMLCHVVRKYGEPQGIQTTLYMDLLDIGNGWRASGFSISVPAAGEGPILCVADAWESPDPAADPDDEIEFDDIARAVLRAAR